MNEIETGGRRAAPPAVAGGKGPDRTAAGKKAALAGSSRLIRAISAAMWTATFAAICVIAYHVAFGDELYRRGQEHAAVEISLAAQKAGAAIAFRYEGDMLRIIMLQKKGSFSKAKRMADAGLNPY